MQIRFEWGADAGKNQGKRLSPLLVCMAHDGGLQGPVEAFHESVGCEIISGCPRKLNATKLGQVVEELWLKLTSLVDGDGLQATETLYPATQEGACHSFGNDVRNGDGFWPMCEAVNCSEAVCRSFWHWKESDKIDVDMKKNRQAAAWNLLQV
jgi:hypothetical protein